MDTVSPEWKYLSASICASQRPSGLNCKAIFVSRLAGKIIGCVIVAVCDRSQTCISPSFPFVTSQRPSGLRSPSDILVLVPGNRVGALVGSGAVRFQIRILSAGVSHDLVA